MTFDYPFDSQDMVDWAYHIENDDGIRYEIAADIEGMLEIPVYDDESINRDDAQVELLRTEKLERVMGFVQVLLWRGEAGGLTTGSYSCGSPEPLKWVCTRRDSV